MPSRPTTTILAITQAALLDLRRRRDPAVLALFAILLLLFISAARLVGIETPAEGTLLLNLSLTLTVSLAHILALVVAARQLPEDEEQRTLHTLLARPIRRTDLLLGKWLAASLAGLLTLFILFLPAWGLAPRLEFYHPATLSQGALLQIPALLLTAALGVTGSLYLPRPLNLMLTGGWIFASPLILRWTDNLPLLYLLPAPNHLNLTLRYTDGIAPLTAPELLILLAAATLWLTSTLSLAAHRFARRALS
jgi:ABC-type transport system involved in multi-copper enzyme maturation permease subunit